MTEALAEKETPTEAAAAILTALKYLEREARLAGLNDLAGTLETAIDDAANTVDRLPV